MALWQAAGSPAGVGFAVHPLCTGHQCCVILPLNLSLWQHPHQRPFYVTTLPLDLCRGMVWAKSISWIH